MEADEIPELIIRCACGQRVHARDVIQRGFYLSLFGSNHIYLRYRCARCRRIGERYIPEDKWNPALPPSRPGRALTRAQFKRFEEMGEITFEEILDFHFALQNLSADPDDVLPQGS